MSLMRSASIVLGIGLLCASCDTIPTTPAPPDGTIHVGQPEVFENADLQAQLDGLRQQLAGLNVIDQPSLIGALGNLQGASATQSGVSLQALQRGLPQVTTITGANAATTTTGASLTPAVPASPVPAAPTLPNVALGSVGVLEQQLQLSSQVLGYELLLTGSDFARYTTNGGTKDKLVVGFPITLNPRNEDRDQAAEVEITYYPPNPNQFRDPVKFASQKPDDYAIDRVCDSHNFVDDNARIACLQQEASPTIVNILPAEQSYNTVVLSSTASTFGLGALIGTVSVGGTFGFGKQTQYLVAQQDTLALQKNGPRPCRNKVPREKKPDSDVTASDHPACDPGSLGVTFLWQFRPVLGQHFVRAGLRRMYVQLAIPYARRPYPNYGGIVEIRTRWRPFDTDRGVPADGLVTPDDSTDVQGVLTGSRAMPQAPDNTPPASTIGASKSKEPDTRAVFGHPFSSPLLSKVSMSDLGSGNLLVEVDGDYLIGASVLVGSTLLNASSPGFVSSYNSLKFTTTVQALAQTGAAVVGSGGVMTPIQPVSLCKYLDEQGECSPEHSNPSHRFVINRVAVEPASDSSSLVRVDLKGPLDFSQYAYQHYFLLDRDVVGTSDDRKPGQKATTLTGVELNNLNRLPIVITAGGKTYGFSDQPFQLVINKESGDAVLSFVATNDSLNAAPELTVKRLFGDPSDDSPPMEFVPPGRLQLTPFNHEVPAQQSPLPKDEAKQQADPKQKPDPKQHPDPKSAAPHAPAKELLKAQAKQENCDKTKKICEYLLVGTMADEAKLYSDGASCAGMIWMSNQGAFGLNARKVRVPDCAKQLTLTLPASESGLQPVMEVIALPIAAPPSTTTVTSVAKTTVQTPNTPNFTLTRSVQNVDESQGIVYILVGIQKLKDSSATLTVSNADIVSAVDGTGAQLSVQAGNQVTVTQDTNLTFELRNATPTTVNVVAEGKVGSTSTGKVQFDSPFNITHRATPPKPLK